MLLFDLDGVLIDSAPAYRQAWSKWARLYRVDEAVIWENAHGRRPEDIIRRVRPDVACDEALEAFDAALDQAATSVAPMAGARQLVGQVPEGRWCIVSSGRRRHVPSMLSYAGLPTPAVLVCGDDVSRGKPDPESFLLAARLLGADPTRCTVVEDAPAGIEAARAAGMHAVALTTTHGAGDLAAADETFASLTEAAVHLLARTFPPSRYSPNSGDGRPGGPLEV